MKPKTEQTLVILKPDVLETGRLREALIELYSVTSQLGVELIIGKKGRFPKEYWTTFYAEHSEQPFFQSLVDFMASGEVMMFKAVGPKVVAKLRKAIGATNPAQAVKGTIRAKFGTTLPKNAVHASDSVKSAQRELAFWELA